MANTPNYDINYEDEQFKQVDKGISQTEIEIAQTYGGMIDASDKYYNDLANNAQQWADKQTAIQQEKTDFAIEQIEQQKEQAHKDYLKEQSGAYVDWRKQSNQYGTEAEKMASAGLDKTGFSESSQVSMYNTYQNRIATARESFNNAVLNYNNAIKDAQIQNNATLAEIAYNALQQQLELSLQGFQYKNQLLIEQANKKIELDNTKWNRYQDVLNQMNTENALAEDIRQYNETQKWETEQAELNRAHDEKILKLEQEFKAKESQLDRDFKAAQAEIERTFTAKENELNRKHALELERVRDEYERNQLKIKQQYELEQLEKQKQNEIAVLNQKLANDMALLAYENEQKKAAITTTNKAVQQYSSSIGPEPQYVSNTVRSNLPIDMQSVTALGYGPISASKLAELENQGVITSYEEGGKLKFRKAMPKLPAAGLRK